jgi:hypothetical protein
MRIADVFVFRQGNLEIIFLPLPSSLVMQISTSIHPRQLRPGSGRAGSLGAGWAAAMPHHLINIRR